MLKYKFINNTVNNIILPINNEFDPIINTDFSNLESIVTTDFIDQEIKRFVLTNKIDLAFGFYDNGNYGYNFTSAGFEEDEITLSNRNYRFSYILMQIYDSYDFKTQNLLHSSYIPIYSFPYKISTIFKIDPLVKYYEFNNVYISNNFDIIDNQKLYCNFKFYNAKSGKLIILYNQNSVSNLQDRFYFEMTFNKSNYTYIFDNQNINAREFVNEEYLNKINQISKSENKKPNYPKGDLFDINGNYR